MSPAQTDVCSHAQHQLPTTAFIITFLRQHGQCCACDQWEIRYD